jgi:FixJ family two-component response regulator
MDEDYTFIAKPYRREALVAALRTAFGREKAWRSTAAAGPKTTVRT